jgi:hypothetical protein
MKKLLAALALVGLFAAGTFTAVAQAPKKDDTKKPADDKKPADAKKSTDVGKASITIKPDAKGRFRLLIKDTEGKGFLMTAGNGFETEKEAKDALDELKVILAGVKPTVEKGDAPEKDK